MDTSQHHDGPLSPRGSFHRLKVGAIEIVALSDGRLDIPLSLFPDAPANPNIPSGPFPTSVNTYAIRSGGRTILVDAGAGPWRGEAVGHTVDALRAAGLDPAAIDVVAMTHLHGDHVGGLRDRDGAVFAKAELLVAEAEAEFWLDPGLPSRAPERMQATIAAATAGLAAYENRTTRFAPGGEIAPGIRSVPLPGHTPGHTGFVIEDGGERLLIWADIIHVAAVQVPHPEWTIAFDVDGPAAAATRQRVFDEVVADDLKVLGMHLAFPGACKMSKSERGYDCVPA